MPLRITFDVRTISNCSNMLGKFQIQKGLLEEI